MGQTGGFRFSSPDGSDYGSGFDANYDEIVVPSPVIPSSHDSPELGSQPSASAPYVSGFDDQGRAGDPLKRPVPFFEDKMF